MGMAKRPPRSARPRGNLILLDPPYALLQARVALWDGSSLADTETRPGRKRRDSSGDQKRIWQLLEAAARSRNLPATSSAFPPRGCVGRELPRGGAQPPCPPFARGALHSLGISHPGATPPARSPCCNYSPSLNYRDLNANWEPTQTSSAPLARISPAEAAQEHPEQLGELQPPLQPHCNH